MGKYWIIPARARETFTRLLMQHWAGTVEIDRIEGGYFSPICATGVTLRDHDGRIWGRADRVTLTYTPWPSISTKLKSVEIESPDFSVHFIDDQCCPPVRDIPVLIKLLETGVDIETFTISNGSIAVCRDGKDAGAWDEINFSCSRDASGYRLTLVREESSGKTCKGRIECSVITRWPDGRSVEYEGDVKLEGLSPGELMRAAGGKPLQFSGSGGTLKGKYEFSGSGLTSGVHKGRGQLHAKKIPGFAGGGIMLPFIFSWDAKVHFTTAIPIIKIEQGELKGKMTSVTCQPGGTINLDTTQLDLHITTSPTLAPTMRRRTHITGQWNTPDGIKVK